MRDSNNNSVKDFNRIISRVRNASLLNNLLQILPYSLHAPLQNIHYKIIQPGLSSIQEKLLDIIQNSKDVTSTIVFPPSLDWHTQLFQRPQQMALALASNDALIFYLQHRENWDDTPFIQIKPNLYLCSIPVETFRCLEGILIYVFTWNKIYQAAFKSPRIIYDYVDDIQAFPGNYSLLMRDHKQLLQEAELVLTTAQRLFEEVFPNRPDAVYCPNGVDYEHFADARQPADRSALDDIHSLIENGSTIIGYHGALAKWFDYDLLACAATARRDLAFVLIGPDYDKSLPDEIINQENIHWLGIKPYKELPDYLRHFDIAMIPFQLTDITHAASPIKLFEYFAAGKPIVTTAISESLQYPGVLVSKDCPDFISHLDEALKLRDDPRYLELSDRIARQNTWGVRARQVLDILAQ